MTLRLWQPELAQSTLLWRGGEGRGGEEREGRGREGRGGEGRRGEGRGGEGRGGKGRGGEGRGGEGRGGEGRGGEGRGGEEGRGRGGEGSDTPYCDDFDKCALLLLALYSYTKCVYPHTPSKHSFAATSHSTQRCALTFYQFDHAGRLSNGEGGVPVVIYHCDVSSLGDQVLCRLPVTTASLRGRSCAYHMTIT